MRERVNLKSPVRENCTPGSVRGASGNRRPYLDWCLSGAGVSPMLIRSTWETHRYIAGITPYPPRGRACSGRGVGRSRNATCPYSGQDRGWQGARCGGSGQTRAVECGRRLAGPSRLGGGQASRLPYSRARFTLSTKRGASGRVIVPRMARRVTVTLATEITPTAGQRWFTAAPVAKSRLSSSHTASG